MGEVPLDADANDADKQQSHGQRLPTLSQPALLPSTRHMNAVTPHQSQAFAQSLDSSDGFTASERLPV